MNFFVYLFREIRIEKRSGEQEKEDLGNVNNSD